MNSRYWHGDYWTGKKSKIKATKTNLPQINKVMNLIEATIYLKTMQQSIENKTNKHGISAGGKNKQKLLYKVTHHMVIAYHIWGCV